MSNEEFKKVVENRFRFISDLLISKSEEYSDGVDKLYNFKRAGQINKSTPERALWGFQLKHYTSLSDIIDNIDKGIYPNTDKLQEKISDEISYLLLLEALIQENKQ